jgi:hypothetical protein
MELFSYCVSWRGLAANLSYLAANRGVEGDQFGHEARKRISSLSADEQRFSAAEDAEAIQHRRQRMEMALGRQRQEKIFG